jgi:hypothetical protein
VWQNLPAISRAAPSTRYPTCRVPVGDRPMGQSACRLFDRSGGSWTPSVRLSIRLQAISRPTVFQSQAEKGSRSILGRMARCTRRHVSRSESPWAATRESGRRCGPVVHTRACLWIGRRHRSPPQTCPSRHEPFSARVETVGHAGGASSVGRHW